MLTEKNGKLYGRGATDDKGPVLGWIHALQAYQQCAIEQPVNFKFCFEGMEESGSEGLDKLLLDRYRTYWVPTLGKQVSRYHLPLRRSYVGLIF